MNSIEKEFKRVLDERAKKGRLRALTVPPSSYGDSNGLIDFSSNDYLSLAQDLTFQKYFQEELEVYGNNMGSGGSRLLDGNSLYVEMIESRIAQFHNAQSGLLFNSGFDANVSIFSCLPQPGDWIIYDELIHASVHDGMKLSRSKFTIPFKHNSINSLDETLKKADPQKNIFVALESVYSMDGDVAPLSEIVTLINSHESLRVYIIVDEAHATGVIGRKGEGLVCTLGLENEIFLRLHTFGKALCSNGAMALCSEITRSYLVNYSRPFIYSTALNYPTLASITAAYKFLDTGDFKESHSRLWDLIKYFDSSNGTPNTSKCSIICKLCKNPKQLSSHLYKTYGIIARPIVYPTVPKSKERLRICIHSDNTEKQIDNLVYALHKHRTLANL